MDCLRNVVVSEQTAGWVQEHGRRQRPKLTALSSPVRSLCLPSQLKGAG